MAQLRTGHCPLVRSTLHTLGRAADPNCRECGALDTCEHLLTECPRYLTTRTRLWGPLPTLEQIWEESATRVVEFLRCVGRQEPPEDDPDPPGNPPAANQAAPAPGP